MRAWLSRSTAPHPSPGSQSGDECINNISSRLLSCSDRNHRPCWNGTPLLQQFKQVYLSKRKLFWWLIKCQPIVVCDRGGANLALVLLLATLNWDIPGPFMEMRHHQIMSWLLNSHQSLSVVLSKCDLCFLTFSQCAEFYNPGSCCGPFKLSDWKVLRAVSLSHPHSVKSIFGFYILRPLLDGPGMSKLVWYFYHGNF